MREHRKPVCTAVFDRNQGKEYESQQPAEAITKDAKRGKQDAAGKPTKDTTEGLLFLRSSLSTVFLVVLLSRILCRRILVLLVFGTVRRG